MESSWAYDGVILFFLFFFSFAIKYLTEKQQTNASLVST